MHWKVFALEPGLEGSKCIGRKGVNKIKTLTFEKGGGCMTPPPASMVADSSYKSYLFTVSMNHV